MHSVCVFLQYAAVVLFELWEFMVTPYDNFPWHQIFEKGLAILAGQASVYAVTDELENWVKEGKVKLDDIIIHRLSLSEAAHAYDILIKRKITVLRWF